MGVIFFFFHLHGYFFSTASTLQPSPSPSPPHINDIYVVRTYISSIKLKHLYTSPV